MKSIQTDITKVIEIQCTVYGDERGFFKEVIHPDKLAEFGINHRFVQLNHSKSQQGILRGLHYQPEPYAQSKLITIIEGEIQDVVVDIRLSSKTFGKYFSIVLSENDSRQLFIPKGFAHGFLTLTKYSIVHYKVDNFYKPDKQFGIAYNDNILGINWKINQKNIIISDKDKRNPFFKDAKYFD